MRIPKLGVYEARQMVLTGGQLDKEMAASPCVNPVVDRYVQFIIQPSYRCVVGPYLLDTAVSNPDPYTELGSGIQVIKKTSKM